MSASTLTTAQPIFNVHIGLDRPPQRRIENEVAFRLAQRVQYVTMPLFHNRLRSDSLGISEQRLGPQTRSDRVLPCRDWSSNFVAKTSDWIDCENANDALRTASQQRLQHELSLSSHLSLRTVLLPPIKHVHSTCHSGLVRVVLTHLHSGSPGVQSMVCPIPMILPLIAPHSRVESLFHENSKEDVSTPHPLSVENNNSSEKDSATEPERSWDGWRLWNDIRTQCAHHTQLSVAIIINDEVLEYIDAITDIFLARWVSEPVKMIVLSTSIFLTNDAGFPVLSTKLQSIVRFFMKHSIGILLSGKSKHSSGEFIPYVSYLRHLQQKEESLVAEEDRHNRSFWDVLQSPLQPLMDHLESQTYETFETDPVKYARYESAVAKALRCVIEQRNSQHHNSESKSQEAKQSSHGPPPALSLKTVDGQGSASSSSSAADSDPVLVYVVGAGRGPLVACTLSAAQSTNIRVRVVAVEKNPFAVITLRNRVLSEKWDGLVTVVAKDMRDFEPTERADILVSELLGSFGDNELSPECIDGAQRRLLKPHGISVPERYTSFLQPIASPLQWMTARDTFASSSLSMTSSLFQSHFAASMGVSNATRGLETPYVVKLHRFCPLDVPKKCWEFVHPNPLIEERKRLPDNSRYTRLHFQSDITATLHGFAGYFHCDLFADETLSIEPRTFSTGMFSWFPIYFPLACPRLVRRGERIAVDLWRCCDGHRVWYEWSLVSPVASEIQNLQGRSSCVGL